MLRHKQFELDRLRAEIANEHRTVEHLESSLSELRTAIDVLERKTVEQDVKDSEWETRYALQMEMNQQLDMQAILLSEKVDQAKQSYNDDRFPKTIHMFQDANEITPQYLRRLKRSKKIFEHQLHNLEWRLEQESKAYHKTNEERKNFVMNINALRDSSRTPRSRRVGSPDPRGLPLPSERQFSVPSMVPDCRRKVLVSKPSNRIPWINGLIVEGVNESDNFMYY